MLASLTHARYQLAVVHALNLTEAERNRCWDLLEQNMKDMYIKSSWGWHPADKLEELFHPDARFILVRRMLAEGLSEVVAFLSFRFDMEEGEEVAYLYEVHVCSSCRRQGLGRILTDQIRRIASHYKMSSVMLTVFEANAPALKLYESLGYVYQYMTPSNY
ncbi:acyl-CoA N-acyltransferase [Schizophyllum commune]